MAATIDRRQALGIGLAAMATPALARRLHDTFLWGAATAGHQVEGNNINADIWLLTRVYLE